MVTINNATVRQNVYETIYDIINGISFSVSSVSVMAAYTDSSTVSLPVVVVNPVDIDYTPSTLGLSRYNSQTIQVVVDIYTRKNKDKDIIADEIDAALRAASFTGIEYISSNDSNAFESPGQMVKFRLKSMVLNFERHS